MALQQQKMRARMQKIDSVLPRAGVLTTAETHNLAAAQWSARTLRDRIRYKAKQEAAAQRSARNERRRIRYKANTQARVPEQEVVSGAARLLIGLGTPVGK